MVLAQTLKTYRFTWERFKSVLMQFIDRGQVCLGDLLFGFYVYFELRAVAGSE